jgi:hypothetical protein
VELPVGDAERTIEQSAGTPPPEGRIMKRADRAFVAYLAALAMRGFAPWPVARGEPVYPPSLADTAKPSKNPIWNRS